VIDKTNETAARAFPAILNTEHPEFYRRLEECSVSNLRLVEISNSDRPQIVKFFQKIPPMLSIMGHMVRLFMMKPINAEATRELVY
ncbi:MAG: magnesium-protoporphyrin IX monomethyl ester cyclase, partial [Cyanobacteria bacterium J06635_10]